MMLAAALVLSCQKESRQIAKPSIDMQDMQVRISASTVPTGDGSFDAALSSSIPDSLHLSVAGARRDAAVLNAVPGADPAEFAGQMQYSSGLAVTAYCGSSLVSCTGSSISGEVPSAQGGDVPNAVLQTPLIGRVEQSAVTVRGDTCLVAAQLRPMLPVIRLNVPDGMGVTSVELHSDAAIAGKWSFETSDWLLDIDKDSRADAIELTRNGEALGGELYFVILPDAFDSMSGEYCSTAKELTFILSDSQGRRDWFSASLDTALYAGSLLDLGDIPDYVSFDKPAVSGSLRLMDGDDLRVTVVDTTALTTFWYELGADRDDCPTPAASSSKQFYAAQGFAPPCPRSYDSWYIKVLVHTESRYSSDLLLEGWLRNWNFDKDSPVAAAVERAQTLLPAKNDTLSAGGMSLCRTNASALSYIQYDNYMQLRSCYLAMNAVAGNDSHAWLHFTVDKYITRGYKLYNNNATYGTTTLNGHNVTATVTKDNSNPYAKAGVTWDLGDIQKGFKAGVRGDGLHHYYSMAFLETGESLEVTEAIAPTGASLKLSPDSPIPLVTLDSAKVAGSIAEGARWWYTVSSEGFDSMGDPSDTDAPLTSEGIIVPVYSSADSLYIKVLGRCEGRSDTYLKAVVSNWKFDKNFIAPTTLASSWGRLSLSLKDSYSSQLISDARIGYAGFGKGAANVTTILSGYGWMYGNFFAGSYNGTTLRMLASDGSAIYSNTMPGKTYYTGNSVTASAPTGTFKACDTLAFDWDYKLWVKDFCVLEEVEYTPASYSAGGDGGIEGYDGTDTY